ncbi:hypothetical protein N5P37_001675, partial [Trichoderma harzianum]
QCQVSDEDVERVRDDRSAGSIRGWNFNLGGVTYEPRGQCRSQQPLSESAYSSEKNAQDFKAVCDRYGVKTAVLAGWSYGGLIATDAFSHLGPGWIRGIVYLLGVPWRSMLPEVLHSDGVNALQPLIEGDAEEVAKSLSSVLDTCFHLSSISSMSYSEHSALAGVIAQQNPTARRLLMNARHQDHTKLLQEAKHLPTMLVIGEFDRQIYWGKLDSFLKGHFPLYRLSLIEGVGHSAFWEKPEEVNPLLETFVDECR